LPGLNILAFSLLVEESAAAASELLVGWPLDCVTLSTCTVAHRELISGIVVVAVLKKKGVVSIYTLPHAQRARETNIDFLLVISGLSFPFSEEQQVDKKSQSEFNNIKVSREIKGQAKYRAVAKFQFRSGEKLNFDKNLLLFGENKNLRLNILLIFG
jgi:hypothetical protein